MRIFKLKFEHKSIIFIELQFVTKFSYFIENILQHSNSKAQLCKKARMPKFGD